MSPHPGPAALRPAWWLAGSGAATMGAALAWGATAGDLAAEGRALLGLPWGVVSLVEVYVGIALLGGWIFWREPSPARAAAWMLAAATIGNLVSCLYVLLALREARGDPLRFWLGARSGDRGR